MLKFVPPKTLTQHGISDSDQRGVSSAIDLGGTRSRMTHRAPKTGGSSPQHNPATNSVVVPDNPLTPRTESINDLEDISEETVLPDGVCLDLGVAQQEREGSPSGDSSPSGIGSGGSGTIVVQKAQDGSPSDSSPTETGSDKHGSRIAQE